MQSVRLTGFSISLDHLSQMRQILLTTIFGRKYFVSDKAEKPLTIKIPTAMTLKMERIRQWEDEKNKNYDDVADYMLNECLYYFEKEPDHFSKEIAKLNDPKFLTRIRDSMFETIDEYVDFTSGFSKNEEREASEDWKHVEKSLSELFRIYRALPSKYRKILSNILDMDDYTPLSDDLLRSFERGMIVAATRARRFEARGKPRRPASFLALALFENLEFCFKRKLIRSFGIASGRLPTLPDTRKNPQPFPPSDDVFTNPDATLIHLLARQIDEEATVEVVSNALKPMNRKR